MSICSDLIFISHFYLSHPAHDHLIKQFTTATKFLRTGDTTNSDTNHHSGAMGMTEGRLIEVICESTVWVETLYWRPPLINTPAYWLVSKSKHLTSHLYKNNNRACSYIDIYRPNEMFICSLFRYSSLCASLDEQQELSVILWEGFPPDCVITCSQRSKNIEGDV